MESKILSKRTQLIVAFIGCTLFAVFLFDSIPKNSIQSPILFSEIAGAHSRQEQTNSGLPVSTARLLDGQVGKPIRLEIPEIKVSATFEYVGLTSKGAMDVPKIPGDVAWFKLGSRPGENGSAVIAGHYGVLKNGDASVFDNLYKLHKGDKLYIEDDKGIVTSFVVVDSRSYDPTADASSVFGSNDGKAHLNLITCEGVWNQAQKSYSKRLVVFTDKETQ